MASKSSKNDVLQIVMMTVYLMALFFGGWGAYNHYFRVADERRYRTLQQSGMTQLTKLLKAPENQEALLQYRRVKSSQEAGESWLSTEVTDVINEMARKPAIKNTSSRSKKQDWHQFSIVFEDTSLRDGLLSFIQQMEGKKPHISFSSVTLTNRGKKGDEDRWTSDFNLVMFDPE